MYLGLAQCSSGWFDQKTARVLVEVAKGAKYIYIARDPRDVLLSFHSFLMDYFEEPGISFEDFCEIFFFGNGSHHGGSLAIQGCKRRIRSVEHTVYPLKTSFRK